jgi:ABC-2 type transport system ATP-binding protein
VTSAIRAEGLTKSFGTTRALAGIDLDVPEGTLLALLGPNGAGKTTAVRIFTTLLRPDAGRAWVAGFDVVRQANRLRASIGLAGQNAAVDEYLTGPENLEMIGRLYHLSRGDARRRAAELIEQFELGEAGNRIVKTYSGGMRRRLDLAGALVVLPPVLFLDEPTTGLDPRGRRQMWDVIRSLLKEGATLLLTTQYLEEADELADRIAVIDHGRVIAEGTSDQLKQHVGGSRVEVTVPAGTDLTHAASLARPHFADSASVDALQRRISGPARDGTAELTGLVRDFDAASIQIVDLQLRRPSLDDVFLTLTGHEAEDQVEKKAPARGRFGRQR